MTDRIRFGSDSGEHTIEFEWEKNPLGEHGVAISIRFWGECFGIFLIDSEIEKLQEFLQEGDDA
jgi:hypothetical protein